MNLSFINLFFILSIFQLLLISVYLLVNRKGKKASNTLLALFFLSMGVNLIDTSLQFNRAYNATPSLAFWGSCMPLLFGPFLFLYVQSLLVKGFVFEKSKWIHFVPFTFCFVITEVSYLSRPSEVQLKLLQGLEAHTIPQFFIWTGSLIFLIFLIYLLVSLALIKRFKETANHSFSDPTYNSLSSISTLIILCMILIVLAVISQLTLLTVWAEYAYAVFALMLLLLIVFIARVFVKSMQKADLFSIVEDRETKSPPQFSAIEESEKMDIVSRLKDHMEKKKPFLEPELTIEQLANQLSVRTKLLSYLINEFLKQNFFDFINRYRIEEARRILIMSEDKKLTILEIMYQVGFNSKSSFNTLFKKYTGKTPTEVKKRV